MAKRVSLAQIAQSTGYARSTVSMALGDIGTISASTRQKIKEVARNLGYVPNPLLASLASHHFDSEKVGAIPLAYLYFPGPGLLAEIMAHGIIETVQEHARTLGYRLEAFKVTDFKSGAEITKILYSRGFQGVIMPPGFPLDMFRQMDWSCFAAAGWGDNLMGESDYSQPLPHCAMIDHFGLVLRAWHETKKRGYKRIGFVLFEIAKESRDDQLRIGAAHFCLQKVPAKFRIPIFFAKIQQASCPRDLTRWIRRFRADAVIGFNSTILSALQHEGFRVPEDIGFAALHRDVFSDRVLAGKGRESGMKEMRVDSLLGAIELLDQQIRHRQYGLSNNPRTLMITAEWIDGQTLR